MQTVSTQMRAQCKEEEMWGFTHLWNQGHWKNIVSCLQSSTELHIERNGWLKIRLENASHNHWSWVNIKGKKSRKICYKREKSLTQLVSKWVWAKNPNAEGNKTVHKPTHCTHYDIVIHLLCKACRSPSYTYTDKKELFLWQAPQVRFIIHNMKRMPSKPKNVQFLLSASCMKIRLKVVGVYSVLLVVVGLLRLDLSAKKGIIKGMPSPCQT